MPSGPAAFPPRPSSLGDFELCQLKRVPRMGFAQVSELVSHVLHARCNRGGVLLVEDVFKVLFEGGLPVQVMLPFSRAGELFLGTVCPPIPLARSFIELDVPLFELQLVHRLNFLPGESAPWPRWLVPLVFSP